jgi:hypothetical protein
MTVGKYLDILKRRGSDISDISDQSAPLSGPNAEFGRLCRFGRTSQQFYQDVFDTLQRRRPDCIEHDQWRQAVQDGCRFLAQWGGQARMLGWTARDLFGLHPVPEKPSPTYRRLSRYDETGLVWLLRGRPVVALTEGSAVIENCGGALTIYRKFNKPAYGPVGDSLDDL